MSTRPETKSEDGIPDIEMSDDEVRAQYKDVFEATRNYLPDARCRLIVNLRKKEHEDRFYALMLHLLEEQHTEYLAMIHKLDANSLRMEAGHDWYIRYLCSSLPDDELRALTDEIPAAEAQSAFDRKLIEKIGEEVDKRYSQLSRKDRKRLRWAMREKPRTSFTHYDRAINEAIRKRISDGTTTDPRIRTARLMRLPCVPR